jgi:hypothetical protein
MSEEIQETLYKSVSAGRGAMHPDVLLKAQNQKDNSTDSLGCAGQNGPSSGLLDDLKESFPVWPRPVNDESFSLHRF